MKFNLYEGNCLEELKKIEDNTIDSVVTDPPYGLSFMGKKWDYDVPSVEIWKEVFRVLKEGGHVLAFGGTRTYHRMVVNIEDAGFEIRDQIQWLYGSGFPKSLNIGKAYDKKMGNEREYLGENPNNRPNSMLGKDIGEGRFQIYPMQPLTKGTSQYEGWGTGLKPANEPICLARKPFKGTVIDCVIKNGVGGINIDESRIGTEDNLGRKNNVNPYGSTTTWNVSNTPPQDNTLNAPTGRFPANIILDEEAAAYLDMQSGNIKSTKYIGKGFSSENSNDGWKRKSHTKYVNGGYDDEGGASRFFYIAKTSKKERNMGCDAFEEKKYTTNITPKEGSILKYGYEEAKKIMEEKSSNKNNHPTVKPINLMYYLVRLITPKGGTVLDPFMGSGSTGIAALLYGCNFVGVEMDADYYKIAYARISAYEKYKEFLK